MKDILTTALGMMIFDDAPASTQTLTGIGIGLCGGMAYSYFSYFDMNVKVTVQTTFLPLPSERDQVQRRSVEMRTLSQSTLFQFTNYLSVCLCQ